VILPGSEKDAVGLVGIGIGALGIIVRLEEVLIVWLRRGLAVQKGEGTAGTEERDCCAEGRGTARPQERACCAEGRGHCWA
jgi:hypothetical protein